jgi:micrococcal nuclease
MLALRAASALALVVAITGCGSGGDAARIAGEPARVPAKVTRHTDGDTLWLSGIGKVRLIGVDTPEVYGHVECYGRQASAFVARLLPIGSAVSFRLGVDPRDRYGRALAYVYLRDGRMLNMVLVYRGYAQPLTIPPNDALAPRFVAAARGARRRGVGLWRPGACR